MRRHSCYHSWNWNFSSEFILESEFLLRERLNLKARNTAPAQNKRTWTGAAHASINVHANQRTTIFHVSHIAADMHTHTHTHASTYYPSVTTTITLVYYYCL